MSKNVTDEVELLTEFFEALNSDDPSEDAYDQLQFLKVNGKRIVDADCVVLKPTMTSGVPIGATVRSVETLTTNWPEATEKWMRNELTRWYVEVPND